MAGGKNISKVVVITGASSGIGSAAAKVLAEQGNQVVLAARRKEKLARLVEEIRAWGHLRADHLCGIPGNFGLHVP
ncbi:MAG: SDR family NAD(P)-dependent oxidoreductase [Lachnospiraceae bacterium]|jgi:NADP-dependent 3-hydroxy acid dehydrogenase YdfG|nr:SDR family NAD(P)-dependent oxidoreductase [Lachnospiraceae bacterium]